MYSVEKTKGINYFRQFDYPLFIGVLALSAIGLVALHSATRVLPKGYDGDKMFLMQVVCMAIGIVFAIITSLIDYKDFKILGVILYLFCVLLLVLVYFIGIERYGARSWLYIPFYGTYQPSELAKVAVVIFISIFLERIKDEQKDKVKNIIKLLIYTAIPIVLIMMQPDDGTAMVFIFIFAVMVFICGISYKYVFGAIGAFILSLPLLWLYVLKEHQKYRIRVFLNPELAPMEEGYNVLQSKMAIGSGQIYGSGLYQGIQTQHMGVPIKWSDFIFSVIGEEMGFIGATAVVLLALFILLRCIYIARSARDSYGSFLVIGITAMFAFHFIENMGMSIGLLPVTGIPLPFVSHGGSAMVTNYVAIGVVLSVSMRRKKAIFNSSQ